jgi:hypothetical protein
VARDLQTLGFIPADAGDPATLGLVEPLGRILAQLSGGGGATKLNIDRWGRAGAAACRRGRLCSPGAPLQRRSRSASSAVGARAAASQASPPGTGNQGLLCWRCVLPINLPCIPLSHAPPPHSLTLASPPKNPPNAQRHGGA